MKYRARQIHESDIGNYLAVLNEVIAERKYLLTTDMLSLNHTAKFVKNAIHNNFAMYVAEYDKKVIGWADIIPREKGAVRHIGELGMGVVPDWRGKGVGKELLSRVIEHSWKIGLTRIELEVFASNKAAISLYEHFGFEHEGTKRNARYIDGKYEDVFVMAQCRI